MDFVDMHNHSLFGVDDGAQSTEEMQGMIDVAYGDGIRTVCFTPHCNPGIFGENSKKTIEVFELAKAYTKNNHPDMELYLGNELRYYQGCENWIPQGIGRTVNNTRHILIDFTEDEKPTVIERCLLRIQSLGYIPILAHAERYENLSRSLKEIRDFSQGGVLIQVDTQSVTGEFGEKCRKRACEILKKRYADIVATDAHDGKYRKPIMSEAFSYISKKYGQEYAEAITSRIPRKILENREMRGIHDHE